MTWKHRFSFLDPFNWLAAIIRCPHNHCHYQSSQLYWTSQSDLIFVFVSWRRVCIHAYLHEAWDGLDGLIRLVEHFPPCVRWTMGTRVFWSLGQKAGHVLHTPVRPAQLGVKEASASVVLEERLFRRNSIQLITEILCSHTRQMASGSLN